MEEPTVQRATGPDLTATELYAILLLRAEVFVVEQACAYLDPDGRDLEPGTTHLWVSDGHACAACARVLTEPGGGHRIGRVVTAIAHRGQHLAGRLIDDALSALDGTVVLDAQSHLLAVYARHGFVADGPEFVEDDIPHTPMRLQRPSA
ncbi:MAG: GNAT family N-acetyltransferase [Acidimicrobiales bacterium]